MEKQQEKTFAFVGASGRQERGLKAEKSNGDLELNAFAALNLKRCEAANGFNHALDSWNPSEWTNAMCGELGEAANLTKKISRHDQGIRGNVKAEDQDRDALRLRAIDEIADVIIYADLAIQRLRGNTAAAVRDKFNRKSIEIGCDILIP